MGKYVYEKKKLRISRRRRKENGILNGLKKDEVDRRHGKERAGIILQDYDRRQQKDSDFKGEEKRIGKDRRSGKDRRG